MTRAPSRSSASQVRMGGGSVGLAVLALCAGVLTACGDGESAAPPTSYARPTTTFTTEPVRTTSPPTTTTIPPPAVPGESSDTGDAPVVDPETGQEIYTIQGGDSVAGIAADYGVTVEALVAANGWAGPDELILPGDDLLIPSADSSDDTTPDDDDGGDDPGNTTPDDADDATTAPGQCDTYEIVAGDNPGRLAERFGVTVTELAAANADTDGYDSYLIGTEIIIPC